MSETQDWTPTDEAEAAEEPDREPESEPEPEPDEETESGEPPSPPEPASDTAMEQIGKKLDRLNKDVSRRIGDILGDMAIYYVPCELCGATNTPGFRLGEGLPEHVAETVMHAIGRRAESDYKPDPYSKVCEMCGGLGEVATGSRVPGQQTLPCVRCKSAGWVSTGPERGGFASVVPPQAAYPPNGDTAAQPEPAFQATPDTPEVAALKAQGYTVIAPSR